MKKFVISFCFPKDRYQRVTDIIKNIYDSEMFINVISENNTALIIDQPVGIILDQYTVVDALMISADPFISDDIRAYLSNPNSNVTIKAQPQGNTYENHVLDFGDFAVLKRLYAKGGGRNRMGYNKMSNCLYINIEGIDNKRDYIETLANGFCFEHNCEFYIDKIEIDIEHKMAKVRFKMHQKEKSILSKLINKNKKAH